MMLTLSSLFALEVLAEARDDGRGHAHDDHAGEVEEIFVQATRSRRACRTRRSVSRCCPRRRSRKNCSCPRYTQLLADGLPLHGGQAASLGLLQVPPSDLGQVEVIKGSSSALYGGQALGGVINLVSKRPEPEPGGEVIFNATTRDAQDLSAYGARPLGRSWSTSLLASYNRQSFQDLDDDDWIDMPGYERLSARPRLFYDGPDGSSAYLTVGAMTEDRRGGTAGGGVAPDGEPFQQDQETRRIDAGLVLERPVASWVASAWRSISRASRRWRTIHIGTKARHTFTSACSERSCSGVIVCS